MVNCRPSIHISCRSSRSTTTGIATCGRSSPAQAGISRSSRSTTTGIATASIISQGDKTCFVPTAPAIATCWCCNCNPHHVGAVYHTAPGTHNRDCDRIDQFIGMQNVFCTYHNRDCDPLMVYMHPTPHHVGAAYIPPLGHATGIATASIIS